MGYSRFPIPGVIVTPPYNCITNVLATANVDNWFPSTVIPVVADDTARNAMFPSPTLNQRVENLADGIYEIWDGTAWIPDVTGAALLAGPSGSSLVGFQQLGTGAIPRTSLSKLREVVSVKDFGAVGSGGVDDYPFIQAAIDYVAPIGGIVYFPPGTYRIDQTLNLCNLYAAAGGNIPVLHDKRLILQGSGSATTRLIGGEPGYGFIEMIGSSFITLAGMSLYSNRNTNLPAYGLSFGRATGNSSAGTHTFNDFHVYGRYTKACIFAMSSEINSYENMIVYAQTGWGVVLAMNNLPWKVPAKYQAFGTGLGGNGLNQLKNVQILNISEDPTELAMACEYVQTFVAESCYFLTVNSPYQVMFRKMAQGATFIGCQFEEQEVEPYSIWFAGDDPCDPNDQFDYRDISFVGCRMFGIKSEDIVKITGLSFRNSVNRNVTIDPCFDFSQLFDSDFDTSVRLPNVTVNTNPKIRIRTMNGGNTYKGIPVDNITARFLSLDEFFNSGDDDAADSNAYAIGCIDTRASGAVANSGFYSQLDAGNVPGVNDFSLFVDFVCPNVTDANNRGIIGLGTTNFNLSGNNTVSAYIYNGALNIETMGPTSASLASYSFSGFVSSFAGKRVRLMICRSVSDSDVAVYINGYICTPSQTTFIGARTWADTIDGDYILIGFRNTSLTGMVTTLFYAAALFNYQLDKDQVRRFSKYGLNPVDQWGSVFGGGTDGCVAYYDFENGGPSSVFDSSSFAQHGTLSGTVVRRVKRLERNSYPTRAGTPIGSVTPAFVGEELLNTSTNQWFKAYGTANTDWKQISNPAGPFLGTVTLVSGSATVSDPNFTTGNTVMVTRTSQGLAPGFLSVNNTGASFVVTSSSNTDDGTFTYQIIKP